MKVINKGGWYGLDRPMEATDALGQFISDTGYDGGRLEDIERSVGKLTVALVVMFKQLPEDQQLEVLNTLRSGWEKVQ